MLSLQRRAETKTKERHVINLNFRSSGCHRSSSMQLALNVTELYSIRRDMHRKHLKIHYIVRKQVNSVKHIDIQEKKNLISYIFFATSRSAAASMDSSFMQNKNN